MELYSILTTEKKYIENRELLDGLLYSGIKALVFCSGEERKSVEGGREAFVKAGLLRTFEAPGLPEATIEDGKTGDGKFFRKVCDAAPSFNDEQYIIEHADADENIIVEAGAGTGKTTVMMDRIMFLMHTVPDLSFSDIGMITFTNEATSNMKRRIGEVLMQRYRATGAVKYLLLLEEQASLDIRTIHSFSEEIISELGTLAGYGQNLAIRSFKYEKRQLARDVLDHMFSGSEKRVEDTLGEDLPVLESIILDFWDRMEQIGLTDSEIEQLDWGETSDAASEKLQATLSSVFDELNRKYSELKNSENAISVGDIIRELQHIFEKTGFPEVKKNRFRFLFVDEFQDSDNAQISVLSWLYKATDMRLFVVGDVKQSIYRFRGAVETAFDRFEETFEGEDVPKRYSLARNYRSAPVVLDALDPIFRNWERKGLLDYGEGLLPQKVISGEMTVEEVIPSAIEQETITVMRRALKDCVEYAKANGKEDASEQKVTVLARTNYQLDRIGMLCRNANIPCYIRREGTFYTSQAVRDFFCLVKAFVFQNDARHLFDYMDSPYCSIEPNITAITSEKAGSPEQAGIMRRMLKATAFEEYSRQFRYRPAMAVIRDIIEETRPEERSSEDGTDGLGMLQYRANLDKLLSILRKHFLGNMASLHSIYDYLRIMIRTDRTEDEPDISGRGGCGIIYGMTVHKAKGLEFDSVIVTFTYRPFIRELETELLIDEESTPKRAGWRHVDKSGGQSKQNSYYRELIGKEHRDIDKEEARLLYVALTRTIRKLYCVKADNRRGCWAELLEVNSR